MPLLPLMTNSSKAKNQPFFVFLVRAISVAFQRKVWRVIWQRKNIKYLSFDYDLCQFDELMFKLSQMYDNASLWQSSSESVKRESNDFLTNLKVGAKILGNFLAIERLSEQIPLDFYGYLINGPEVYSYTEKKFSGIDLIVKPLTFWQKYALTMNFNPFGNEENEDYTED